MTININGAGISGLTAGLNLATEGYDVNIYEKEDEVGGSMVENAQMLPNWMSRNDIINYLESFNVEIDPAEEVRQAEVFFGDKKILVRGEDKPFGYTVLRGGENSLEKRLANQFRDVGGTIRTGETCENPDIIATGSKKPHAIVYGEVFEGDFNPERVKAFFSSEITPKSYYYFYPHSEDRASIVVTGVKKWGFKPKKAFEKLLESEKLVEKGIEVGDKIDSFGAFANCFIPEKAEINGSLLVGEAAGFQDYLTGFGMKFAFESGYLSARSIIDDSDYEKLWRKKMYPDLKKAQYARDLYNITGENGISKAFGKNEEQETTEKVIESDIQFFEDLWHSRFLKPGMKITGYLPENLRVFLFRKVVERL